MALVSETTAHASNGEPVLAVNSGSSSLKFGLYRHPAASAIRRCCCPAEPSGIGHPNGRLKMQDANGKKLLDEAYRLNSQGARCAGNPLGRSPSDSSQKPAAIGHRDGPRWSASARPQPDHDTLIEKLEAATQFAPIHIPAAIGSFVKRKSSCPAARNMRASTPPSTAPCRRLHATSLFRSASTTSASSATASTASLTSRSSASWARRFPARVVCAHLGSGASLVALRKGKSIDTSMGMTPVGGIPMATRSGDFDPGVVLFLMRTEQLSADQLESSAQ